MFQEYWYCLVDFIGQFFSLFLAVPAVQPSLFIPKIQLEMLADKVCFSEHCSTLFSPSSPVNTWIGFVSLKEEFIGQIDSPLVLFLFLRARERGLRRLENLEAGTLTWGNMSWL